MLARTKKQHHPAIERLEMRATPASCVDALEGLVAALENLRDGATPEEQEAVGEAAQAALTCEEFEAKQAAKIAGAVIGEIRDALEDVEADAAEDCLEHLDAIEAELGKKEPNFAAIGESIGHALADCATVIATLDPDAIDELFEDVIDELEDVIDDLEEEEDREGPPPGLLNALGRVQNENARAQLEKNLAKHEGDDGGDDDETATAASVFPPGQFPAGNPGHAPGNSNSPGNSKGKGK